VKIAHLDIAPWKNWWSTLRRSCLLITLKLLAAAEIITWSTRVQHLVDSLQKCRSSHVYFRTLTQESSRAFVRQRGRALLSLSRDRFTLSLSLDGCT
jgi:hypothetical protein